MNLILSFVQKKKKIQRFKSVCPRFQKTKNLKSLINNL
jgi:hypothetical protein